MKICPMGAELFLADGWMDKQTWQSHWWLFAVLQTKLKTTWNKKYLLFAGSGSTKFDKSEAICWRGNKW